MQTILTLNYTKFAEMNNAPRLDNITHVLCDFIGSRLSLASILKRFLFISFKACLRKPSIKSGKTAKR